MCHPITPKWSPIGNNKAQLRSCMPILFARKSEFLFSRHILWMLEIFLKYYAHSTNGIWKCKALKVWKHFFIGVKPNHILTFNSQREVIFLFDKFIYQFAVFKQWTFFPKIILMVVRSRCHRWVCCTCCWPIWCALWWPGQCWKQKSDFLLAPSPLSCQL